MKTSSAWKNRFAVGVAFIACVGVALTLEAGVTISGLTPAAGAAVTNGVPVTVTAQLATNDGSVVQSVEIAYAWNGGDWNTQTMSGVSGTNYAATIPPAVSSLAFYVTCRYDTTDVVSSATNAVSTTLPDYMRYADRTQESQTPQDYKWVPTASGPPYTNWVYTIGSTEWVAEDCDSSTTAGELPPGGNSRYFRLRSLNANVPFIRTPNMVEGVGTIYFTSMIRDSGYGAQLAVQYTTTNTLPTDWRTADIWQTATNIVYPRNTGIKELYAEPIVLNNRAIRYVRFLRTDNGAKPNGDLPLVPIDGTINIDNIAISRPPTDVTITPLLQNPGYPSQDQEVRVRCQVNDVESAIPSVNRRVTVTHSWGETNLVPLGGGVYEGVILRHGEGTNSYSFACDFDGYSYSRDPDGAGGAQTNRNERIGRAELGQFEYGIRPFRSDVQVMQVVTNPAAAGINMELVGDHVWQWTLTNAAGSTLDWTFAGLAGYTNNASAYDASPWTWGDTNQIAPHGIPLNGFAERDTATPIAATGIASNLMIRLNRQTGEYIATAEDLALWNIAPAPGSQIGIGRAFTVGAEITPLIPGSVEIVGVWLVSAGEGGAVITNQMTATTTNRYEGVMSRLPVGTLTNYVLTLYSIDGVTNSIISQPIVYTLTDALDASRSTDFRLGTWTPEDAAQTNYAYQVDVGATSTWWMAEMGKYPVTNGVPLPPGSVSPAFGLRAQTNAFLQSPCLTNGVGTVYFTSVMGDTGQGGRVAVQYTTNSVPGNWQTATTLVYAAISGYRATNSTPVTLNNRDVRYVRLVRQDSIGGLDVGLIYFDNIYLSPPPTQVTITEALHNPGYPASNQAVTVRCRVADVDAGNPSTDRRVQAHYSWNSTSGPWTHTNMVLNGAGVYEGTIPQLGAGTNYYYFTCDYDGYFYTHDPDGAGPQPPYQEVDVVNPAYLGRPEAPRSYEIRPFHSDVKVMQVVTPASAIPMELVSNHLWRVRTPILGITSQSWTFAGVEGYTNNAAGYAAAPWVWGTTNRTPLGLPVTNGVALRDVTTNIVITGLADGLLTIEMNGTNGRYSVVAETYVTPQFLSPASGAGLTNGSPVTVVVQLTAASGAAVVTGSVVLSYVWNNGSVITQAMTAVTGTNLYTATIPPAVTSLSYSVAWQYTLDGATYTAGSSTTANTVSSTLLDYVRYADRDQESLTPQDYKWVPTASGPPYTNWVYRIGDAEWVAEDCDSSATAGELPPGGNSRYFRLRSLNANVPFIRTPYLAEGVGTIYFTSMIKDLGYGAQLAVQYTTTNDLPTDWRTADIWQTATNIVYPRNTGIKELYATPIVLNNREIRYVRFLRTDNGAKPNGYLPPSAVFGTINIDNIYISRPPTGVTLTEKLYNPGYPAQDQEVKVRCQVDDVDLTVPSVNRRVKVWYSWQSESGPWTQTNMVAIAERVYEGVIPQRGAGRMYYWFQCDLDGYFYSRDPDGPTGPQPARDEKVGRSPVYLIEKGEDNYRNYEIRRYRSDVEAMRVVCSNVPSASIDSLDLVGDHVWQGLTLVSGITNLLWTFVGTNGYANDAEAFDTNTWSWGDNDQDFPYPPVAGYAERNATNSIQADLVYNGTLLIRMNGQTGEYLVKRAVYQNFDVWPASQTDFEESLGLFAIQTFKQDFNTNLWGYGYDAYSPSGYASEPVDTTPVTGFVRGSPTLTWNFWAYDYARVVKERNVLTAARRAIELEGGASRGHVWNTSASKTRGIETFGFQARLSLNDRYFSYFKATNGFNPFMESPTWPKGYRVETTFNAASVSPGLASCSVLTWFTPGASTESGEPSYYETRVTQADPTAGGASQLQLALYRWKDGAATTVGTPQIVTGGQPFENELTTLKALRVQMPPSGNTITTRVGRIDESSGTNIWYYTAVFTDPTPLTDIGTVGFGSYDAQPAISSLKVFDGTNTINLLPGDNWGPAGGLSSANWNMGGRRISTDGAFRWRISGNSLVRDIPSQTLKIYTYPMPDGNNWHPDDFRTKLTITNLVVTSLGYTPFAIPIMAWDPHFVEIQNAALGEINAVVDALSLSPWRAVTRSDKTTAVQEAKVDDVLYYNWTSQAQQEKWMDAADNTGWLVMEGWLNTSAGSKGGEAQFIRSRANTDLVQALVSPYLANNIGSIAFDWRASGVSNVVFAIDRTDRFDYPAWVASPVLIVTNDALSGTVNLSIRTDYPGRVRIRLCEGTAPNAVFKIDNLVVRDYPLRDDTTWQAYNALITETQPSRAFEPTKPGAQTAFLNNDPTNGVALSERLDQHQPFIQTPNVGTGIGEITFWYRVWDTNGGDAVISLQAAPDENGPWKTLTNLVVASTQTNYLYFSNDQIYEPDHKVLRLYGSTNANRVCIDNVLMTEPVRAGYEFRLVSLLPAQPLVGEPPGLKVEIGRFIMNPTNIRIYASWFIGTNTWGYTNWWTTAYLKVELTNSPGAPRVFQTPDDVVLPAGAVDDVVQFFVWGVHGGIDIGNGDRPILQDTNSFVNPPWYYPADLNAVTPREPGLPALGSRGWSPYYYVYSCPPYSVWVNELRYYYWDYWEADAEFIEIIGPAGASLGGWQLQMMSTENTVNKESVITNGFVLKNTTNGWGFLIWGDDAMSSYGDHILFPDWAPGWDDMPLAGGVRVVRSNGAWEDRVAWGWGAESLVNQYGYTYAGARDSEYTLSQRSTSTNLGSKASDFTWGTVEATPDAVNKFQRLYDISAVPIGFYMIYSAIGPNGAHSLGSNPGTIEIAPGGSTNIVYTADTWYRIGTMRTNGVSVGAAPGLKVYTQAFVNVQSAISNQVTFTNATWTQTGLTSSVPIPWASTYYPTSEAAAVANTNIARDYLLNIIPTNNHAIAFAIESITVSNAVTVTVKLADGGDPLATTINGAVKLYGKPTLDTAGWSVIAAATVSNANFTVSGTCSLPAFPTQTNTFFKAIIE